MIQSTITELTKDGWREVGKIAARDGGLFYMPENDTLASICAEPMLDQEGKEVSPDDAEAFVEALSFQYHGSYLRASVAEEVNDEEEDEGDADRNQD